MLPQADPTSPEQQQQQQSVSPPPPWSSKQAWMKAGELVTAEQTDPLLSTNRLDLVAETLALICVVAVINQRAKQRGKQHQHS